MISYLLKCALCKKEVEHNIIVEEDGREIVNTPNCDTVEVFVVPCNCIMTQLAHLPMSAPEVIQMKNTRTGMKYNKKTKDDMGEAIKPAVMPQRDPTGKFLKKPLKEKK